MRIEGAGRAKQRRNLRARVDALVKRAVVECDGRPESLVKIRVMELTLLEQVATGAEQRRIRAELKRLQVA